MTRNRSMRIVVAIGLLVPPLTGLPLGAGAEEQASPTTAPDDKAAQDKAAKEQKDVVRRQEELFVTREPTRAAHRHGVHGSHRHPLVQGVRGPDRRRSLRPGREPWSRPDNVNSQPISDAATIVRPANLRGLAPDHTLVLVNGKRRHRAAVIYWLGNGVADGAQGPDISAIPAIALKRVEVLRDGAAAQYGSDAIAGVMNFILNDASSGSTIETR